MKKVLVTGATGFIGLHCVHQLLEKGYAVRGTLRSQSRAQEVRDGLSSTGVDVSNLELVEADLLKDDGWEDAVTGMDYICLLYTSPSPRDATLSRMPSSA